MIKSKFGQEITKVNIYADPDTKVDRYVVAHTDESLLLSDLETGKFSEVS